MPQAVEIVSQSPEQGLASLGKQAAASGAARQFALGDGEDGFNQGAAAVFLARKSAHIWARTPCRVQVFFPRLAGMTLSA